MNQNRFAYLSYCADIFTIYFIILLAIAYLGWNGELLWGIIISLIIYVFALPRDWEEARLKWEGEQ